MGVFVIVGVFVLVGVLVEVLLGSSGVLVGVSLGVWLGVKVKVGIPATALIGPCSVITLLVSISSRM